MYRYKNTMKFGIRPSAGTALIITLIPCKGKHRSYSMYMVNLRLQSANSMLHLMLVECSLAPDHQQMQGWSLPTYTAQMQALPIAQVKVEIIQNVYSKAQHIKILSMPCLPMVECTLVPDDQQTQH